MESTYKDFLKRSFKKGGLNGIGSLPKYLWWMIKHIIVLFLDLTARHMPIVGLRESLFRIMGYDIGKGAFIAENVHLDRAYRHLIHIGEGTTIQYNTVIFGHQRDFRQYRRGNYFRDCDYRLAAVIIGKRVMIGPNCVILPGVNIGDGAVIGAGSVVYRNVPPYTFAMGVPARIVKKY